MHLRSVCSLNMYLLHITGYHLVLHLVYRLSPIQRRAGRWLKLWQKRWPLFCEMRSPPTNPHPTPTTTRDLHPPAVIEISDNRVRVRSFIYLLIYRFICLFISTLQGHKVSAAMLPNSTECSLSPSLSAKHSTLASHLKHLVTPW